MAFMRRFITEKMDWLVVDGTNGNEYIPLADTGLTKEQVEAMQEESLTSEGNAFLPIDDFCTCGASGTYSVMVVNGHGCRLSAPGYMDCTEWAVFDTEKQCIDYFDEYYPEDEETDDDD